jgi:hypothetical protein
MHADLPGRSTRATNSSFTNPVTTIDILGNGWMNFTLEFYIGSTDLAYHDNTVGRPADT